MNIDALLNEVDPGRPLTLREQVELERLIDSTRVRRRTRAKFVLGVAALSAFLLAGGGAATAAAGIWHPSWYDAASDWTTEVKTVNRSFAVDGKQYHSSVTLALESTYNGKGTPEFQKALADLRSMDPTSITPSASDIDDLINASWVGQGPKPATPSRAWANQQVWLMDVSSAVSDHVNAIGLDGEKIRLDTTTGKCDATR